MASRTFLLCVALLSVLALAKADEFSDPNVFHLTSSNYDEKVGNGKVWFIKYYAPWCGHCKRLADTWKQLGAAYKGNKQVEIAHIDCTQARDVCSQADIKGYPTLKAVYKGEEYKPYRGQRELSALKAFVDEAVSDLLTESN